MNSVLPAEQKLLLQICKLLWAFANSPLTFEDELMYAFIILGQTVFDGQNNFFAKKFLKELFHQSKKPYHPFNIIILVECVHLYNFADSSSSYPIILR